MNRRTRMETAIKSIPFEQIEHSSSQAIRDVLNNPSFYRQLPQRTLDCDPQLLTFMVRHPEVMVNIWEMVGITNITAKRTGQRTFFADDGAGTKCNCELVYSDNGTHIYYGTGNYEGMLMPRAIKGRVVCVLRSQSLPSQTGHSGYSVDSNMDVFLKVDNLGADLLTRTLGPLVGKVTEHNFEESSKFVGQFSEFCAHNPHAARNLAEQLSVSDESIRQQFISIASRIGNQGRERSSIASGLVVDDLSSDSPEQASSEGLKDSLGHIRLATLPDLMAAPETTSQTQLPDAALTADSKDLELHSPNWTAIRDSETASRSNLLGSDATLATDSRKGGITPRRTGISLRR